MTLSCTLLVHLGRLSTEGGGCRTYSN